MTRLGWIAAAAMIAASAAGARNAIAEGDIVPRVPPAPDDEARKLREERAEAHNRRVAELRARRLERDRPAIEAAQAKRERRAAKRLAEAQR